MKVLNISPLSFDGRITRKTFWLANIFLCVATFAAYLVIVIVITLLPEKPSHEIVSAINLVVILIALLGLIVLALVNTLIWASLVIRRAHDIGSSGWLWLFGSVLLLVPWVILGLLPGRATANKFGSTRY